MPKNMTVAMRLGVGFGLIVLVLGLTLLLALSRLSAINGLMTRVVEQDWQKARLANESALLMNAIARQSYSLFLLEERQATIEQIMRDRQAITQRLEKLQALLYLPEGQALMDEVTRLRRDYVASYQQVLDALQQDQPLQARQRMLNETVPALERLLAAMQGLVDLQGRILQTSGLQASRYYVDSRQLILSVMLLAIGAALGVAVWIIRSVTRPLGGEPEQVKQVVERIADGDLQGSLVVRPGDAQSLMAAMQRMQMSLAQMLGALSGNADGVAGASLQLAAASRQITSSSAQQSQASSGMAAAVEQLSVSISQVSAGARQAQGITADSQRLSTSGQQLFSDTLVSMRVIAGSAGETADKLQVMGERTQSIDGIIQLIREVAEQTNLLALNAAIEAARAGSQGRGFAVVADEVRQLAERTSQATVEISAMISEVQDSAGAAAATMQALLHKVDSGMRLAEQTAATMQDIGTGAQQLLGAVDEICAALQEQSHATTEIAERIEQIAQMSEENHHAIAEVMQTAEQLEQLAVSSLAAVKRFRL